MSEGGIMRITAAATRRYALDDIHRAYEDLDTDGVGRGVIVL